MGQHAVFTVFLQSISHVYIRTQGSDFVLCDANGKIA